METNLIAFLAGALVVGLAAGDWGRYYLALRGGKSLAELNRRTQAEAESKDKIAALEARLLEREVSFDKRLNALSEGETAVREKTAKLESRETKISEQEDKVSKQLERVGGLSKDEAKEELMAQIRDKNSQDLAQILQKIDRERRDEIEKKALDIITVALQRYARSHISEVTTTVFPLNNEEIKGKIIGREGRNIRALKRATGVEFS